MLFLIPAMLVIRREIALIAATLIATTSYEGSWAGIVLITVALVGAGRYRGLAEPAPSDLSRESSVLGANADA